MHKPIAGPLCFPHKPLACIAIAFHTTSLKLQIIWLSKVTLLFCHCMAKVGMTIPLTTIPPQIKPNLSFLCFICVQARENSQWTYTVVTQNARLHTVCRPNTGLRPKWAVYNRQTAPCAALPQSGPQAGGSKT